MTSWIIINTNTSISNGSKFLVDTSSGAITLEFPSVPFIGDEIFIADAADWSINNLTLISANYGFSNNERTVVLKNKRSQYQFIFDGDMWIIYNVSLSTSKISDLPATSQTFVSDDDLLLYIDKDSGAYESKSITYKDFKSTITRDSYNTVQELILDLNSYIGLPELNTRLLNNENSDYYLNYANLTNKPNVPALVTQAVNNLGFVRNLSSFTTDNLAEGFDNKYLSQANFTALFDTAFATSFRLYSGDFSETTITDSLDNIPATSTSTQVDTATNVLQVSTIYIDFFKPGQNIRVYGGNFDLETIAKPSINSTVKNGFAGPLAGDVTLDYRMAQFDLFTGKVSDSTTTTQTVTGIDFTAFNQSNNVQLSYNRTSTNYGILIYRKQNGGSYDLIDILGQKELGTNLTNMIYRDYGTFNYTTWSKRNVNTGAYDAATGTMHFPLTAPGTVQRGWVDALIVDVDVVANTLILNDNYYFNTSVIISHNDTQRIQAAINQRVNAGINSLTLNDKQYVISRLNIPTQFSLYGRGRDTVLKKLPWSTENTSSMLSMSSTIARNVNLSNFNIDGNMQNQWLKEDAFDASLNYVINMKTESETVAIDRVHISNVIGGGVFARQPSRLLINLSRIEDSGMTDFYEYSPLIADDGVDVIVTNNTFKNFSDAIDLSITLNGVCSSNVVENVGAGILVFGSRFFISSQNLIKGPAGEYIPGPDILNSSYDSINIILEPNIQYPSDTYRYQENGNNFDLTANRAVLSFSLDKLKKTDNSEELYGQILINGNNPLQRVVDTALDPIQGLFRFSISQSDVNAISSTYSYSTLKAIDPNHVGLVYRALLTEYVDCGTILAGPIITNGTDYTIGMTNYSKIAVGSRVRTRDHGGNPDLNEIVGTIINIVDIPPIPLDTSPPEIEVTIRYDQTITNPGANGFLTVENTFVLAKGRIL